MRRHAIVSLVAAQVVIWGCAASDSGFMLGLSQGTRRQQAHETARSIVARVAPRQIATLADGDYMRGTWLDIRDAAAPRGIAWNYPWGVTLYGLLHASETTGDRTLADFVIRHNEIVGRYHQYLRWVQEVYAVSHRADVSRLMAGSALSQLLILGSLESCGAMSSQMLEGLLRHKAPTTQEQSELLASVETYIFATQSRLPDGAFWRPEAAQTLWIEDLYMSCPFLMRRSEQTGDPRFRDDAARQIVAFASRLQDSDGLWYHGSSIAQGQSSPYKWGRGNGWAMMATVEVLSALPERHPERARLLAILRRHIAGIAPLQAPSGRWRQVLDNPELWEETSCTAMFTYSIVRAVRRGWIGRESLELAWLGLDGLDANITEDGEVNGTCQETSIGQTLNYYKRRQRLPNDPHGPGPVLLAAAEVLAEDGQ